MTRSTASHPETKAHTPCGQSCDTCGKAEGCHAALSIIAQMLPAGASDDCQPAGDTAWK